MVIGMENGKINLSIRRTQPAPTRPQNDRPKQGMERPRQDSRPSAGRPQDSRPSRLAQSVEKQPQSFDDMLKQFMADSDSKISGIKQYSDRKTKTRRR